MGVEVGVALRLRHVLAWQVAAEHGHSGAPQPSPLRGSAPGPQLLLPVQRLAHLGFVGGGCQPLRCALPRPFRALRPPAVGAVPAIARSGPATVGVLPHRAARPATTGRGWAGSSAPGAEPSGPGGGGRACACCCTSSGSALHVLEAGVAMLAQPLLSRHASSHASEPARRVAGAWAWGQNCGSSAHGSALRRMALPS